MKKYKLTKNQIINIVILGIIYFTWIISTTIIANITSIDKGNRYIWSNLIGTVFAFIYTIFLHYPMIPFLSKNISPRIELEAVFIRRKYCMTSLYAFIVGFFFLSITLLLDYDDIALHPTQRAWGVPEIFSGLIMLVYASATAWYCGKMRSIVYMDKLQRKNADIEENA